MEVVESTFFGFEGLILKDSEDELDVGCGGDNVSCIHFLSLKEAPTVRFDTIKEDGTPVPYLRH